MRIFMEVMTNRKHRGYTLEFLRRMPFFVFKNLTNRNLGE